MRKLTVILVAAAVATPAPLLGATSADNGTTYSEEREDDDNDFPWGLLGLVGLAGLLGRKRNERDIHVDARRDRNP
jgi:hypothetical protein